MRNGRVVDVAGVAVRLHASDERRADAIAALFRHAVPLDVEPDCVLRFTASAAAVPEAEPDTSFQGLELWRPAAGVLVVRSARGLSAHVTRDAIDIGGDAPSLAREFRFVAMVALTHALAHRGRHVLHGGAVVCDGRAVLVLGGTGKGKSTLVLSALQSGWSALTDDLVALQLVDGLALATGLPRPISIPVDVLDDDLAGGLAVPDDPRQRVELPASTFTPTAHPVAGVVVVARGSSRVAELEPFDSHDALRTVLQSSLSLADPGLMRDVFAIAGALARLPAWTLHHGSDPATRVAEAQSRLDEIRAALS